MGWAHAAKMSVSINVLSWNVSTRAACMRALGILVDALTLSLSFAVSFPCSDRPSAHQDDLPVHQQANRGCPHSHHGLLLRRHRCAHGGGCCTVPTCMHSTTPRLRCSSTAPPPHLFPCSRPPTCVAGMKPMFQVVVYISCVCGDSGGRLLFSVLPSSGGHCRQPSRVACAVVDAVACCVATHAACPHAVPFLGAGSSPHNSGPHPATSHQ